MTIDNWRMCGSQIVSAQFVKAARGMPESRSDDNAAWLKDWKQTHVDLKTPFWPEEREVHHDSDRTDMPTSRK